MGAFIIFYCMIVFQRLIELLIAKRNEKWMKARGALEFGQAHYRVMVLIHVLFLLLFFVEVISFNKTISSAWPILLTLFFITQAGRIWALKSLGRFWNTKIIVLPHASITKRGPYRYLKHPNYVIVIIEILVIPLMFKAYFTFALFTLLNIIILSIRIPAEEQALKQLTDYNRTFGHLNRFIPKNVKKL